MRGDEGRQQRSGMSDEKSQHELPPAYPADTKPGAQYYPPPEKKEMTLLHTPMTGISTGPQSSLLIPPDTAVLRCYTARNNTALSGIECLSRNGMASLIGHRTASCTDHRIARGAYVTRMQVRSGHWIDAMRCDFSDGTSMPWCGGQGGSCETYDGVVVGCVVEVAGDVVGRFGAITAPRYADYVQFYESTRESGMHAEAAAASSSAATGTAGNAGEGKHHVGESTFRWDTGRWTGNRGVGVRWNHERRRVEIYQGSNDSKKY